jgi:hypothetical protein
MVQILKHQNKITSKSSWALHGSCEGMGQQTSIFLFIATPDSRGRPLAAILIMAQEKPEMPVADVVRELQRVHPNVWPSLRIIELGDRMLTRGEEIISAVQRLYRDRLEQHRRWHSSWPSMVETGRSSQPVCFEIAFFGFFVADSSFSKYQVPLHAQDLGWIA